MKNRTLYFIFSVFFALPLLPISQCAGEYRIKGPAVGPWRIDAEDFSRGKIFSSGCSISGKVVSSTENFSISNLPLPETRDEILIYARVKPAGIQEKIQVVPDRGNKRADFSSSLPCKTGNWEWLEFTASGPEDSPCSFSLHITPDGKDVSVDCIVIATGERPGAEELSGARGLFSHRPLVRVGRTAEKPLIDGRVDGAAWKRTTALSNFSVVESQAPAREKTTVRLTYDEENLYVSFVCEESILDVIGQQVHEFRAEVETRGGPVWKDDSVFILLRPEGNGNYYDFFINSKGVINDAERVPPGTLENRNPAWNSAARAAGKTGGEYWSLEIAIPFADMAGSAPEDGERWEVSLGRSAVSRGEKSSWNPAGDTLYNPGKMGTIVFARNVPGVNFVMPERFESGPNVIEAEIVPPLEGGEGLYLLNSVRTEDMLFHGCRFIGPGESGKFALDEFDIRGEKQFMLDVGALNALTLEPVKLKNTSLMERRSIFEAFTVKKPAPETE